MPDDFSKGTPNKINWDINLPSTVESNNEEDVKEYPLFHCPSCGIHPQVICQTHVKGFDEIIQVRLLNIFPHGEEIIFIMGDQLPGDVETFENLICGVCGKAGHRENVPEVILVANGIIGPSEISTNDD